MALTWSLSDWVLVALREVVHIVVTMLLDTVWYAVILKDGVFCCAIKSLSLFSVDRILVHAVLSHLNEGG
jgi:hypothetical protein